MSHHRSIIHHFFPLNVQVLEKNFLRKSYHISGSKIIVKGFNFALTNCIWVIRSQQNFFIVCTSETKQLI